MLLVFTSLPNKKSAKAMANKIIRLNLAACINYWQINSIYKWKGKFVSEKEWLLEAKTNNAKKLMNWIEKNHPYKIPMIYSIKPNSTSKKYEKWISDGG